ncbi:MAG: sugar phosphate isomerase/epimerase family protein [Actinomycetota bacterium]
MKYGINTLLYAGTFTDEYLDLFKKFKSIGFDGVEIALENKGDIDYGKTLKAYKENKLECCSICGLFGPDRDIRGPNREYVKNGINYIKDCIDACVNLECNLFVGPSYSSVGRANLETEEDKKKQWETVVESYKEVCDYAKENGVYIAIEPLNRFETDFINICKDAIRMVEDVGSEMLKIHLDTFHMNIEEKSSRQAILDADNLLYLLHASENDRGTPGTGQVHWNEIAEAIREIGYDKYVVIESFTPEVKVIAKAASIWRPTEKDAFTLAEKGIKFLKNLFG